MSEAVAQPGARRGSVVGLVIIGAVVLLGVVLVYNGGKMIVQRQTGERVQVTVTRCVDSGGSRNHRTDCVGTWTVGGEVRTGKVHGATSDKEGKTIEATLDGDDVRERGLALPLMLVGLGLMPVALGLVFLRGLLTKPPVPQAPAG